MKIKVPKTPKRAFNKERPASDLTPVTGRDPNRFDGRWMWDCLITPR